MSQDARRRWLAAFTLATATLALYAPALGFEFLEFDDRRYVQANAWVQRGLTGPSVRWAFETFYFSNWHPLTWLSYMFDFERFGLDPAGYHATNIVLHALNAGLLLGVLAFMTGRLGASALVAALFAWHPLHVESVAWIAERKDVLSTALGLLSLWAYASYARSGRRSRYALCALFLALGLMAKPMLVSWPLLFLLLDHWPLQRTAWARRTPPVGAARAPACPEASWPRLLVEKLPLLALCLASSVLTLLAQTRAIESAAGIALPLRIANAAVACVRYLGKTCWPFDLSLIYPHPYLAGGTPWNAGQIAACMSLLFGVSTLAVALRRRPYLVTGWLWYLVSLVPVLGLVQVGFAGMADRYTYVPLIGIFVMLAWGAADLVAALARRWPRLATGVAAALALLVLAACALRSADQLSAWRDSETLYRRSLASTPDSVHLRQKLGTLLLHRGESREARDHLREALRLAPGWYQPAQNLAWLEATHPDPEIRNPAHALELARAAAATREGDANLLDTLAAAYAADGDFKSAVEVERRALALARERGETALLSGFERRLGLYEAGRPYLEEQPE